MVIDVSSLQEIKLSMNIVRTGAANRLIAQTLRSNDTEIEGGRGFGSVYPQTNQASVEFTVANG